MRRLLGCASVLALCGCAGAPATQPADTVFLDGYVYTADAAHSVAQAVAVRGDRIVAVGDDAAVRALVGPRTEVIDLDGRMLMPGLQDAHIHALETVVASGCDLDNEPVSLAELAAFVGDCTERFPGAEGEFLLVRQWNYAAGNQPGARLPTLRAALDAGSPRRPVLLLGSDGHHGAAARVGFTPPEPGTYQLDISGDGTLTQVIIWVGGAGQQNGLPCQTSACGWWLTRMLINQGILPRSSYPIPSVLPPWVCLP